MYFNINIFSHIYTKKIKLYSDSDQNKLFIHLNILSNYIYYVKNKHRLNKVSRKLKQSYGCSFLVSKFEKNYKHITPEIYYECLNINMVIKEGCCGLYISHGHCCYCPKMYKSTQYR